MSFSTAEVPMFSRRCGGYLLAAAVVALSLVRAQAGDDKALTLTDSDDGKKFSVKKGEALVLKLEGNPTTGFTWVIAKNTKEQLTPPAKPEIVPFKKGVVGGKATFVFRFQAAATGTSDLELHYKRPFEKDVKPAKTFKVTIEVK